MNEQVREVRVDPKVLGAIRRATIEDLPFFADLIRHRYGDRFHHPDKCRANLEWLAALFARRDYTCLRGEHSAGVARVLQAYGAEPQAQVVGLAAWPHAGLEPLRMLRVMLLWARMIGASKLTLSADTGVDFEPFAKRLGGVKVVKVTYDISTEQDSHG